MTSHEIASAIVSAWWRHGMDRAAEVAATAVDQAASAQNKALTEALHDTINAPKGVVPSSAEPFYSATNIRV